MVTERSKVKAFQKIFAECSGLHGRKGACLSFLFLDYVNVFPASVDPSLVKTATENCDQFVLPIKDRLNRKVGNIALERKLLGLFNFEGQRYEYNFSKFWTHTKTSFSFKEEEDKVLWHVDQRTKESEMVSDVTCLKKDMIFIRYESPKGEIRHQKLFNGVTGTGRVCLYRFDQGKKILIDSFLCKNVGCEYGEYSPK